jgi:tRNA(fMet)-specific endonuclease VapC
LIYRLDTDHLSLLERCGAESLRLQMRLDPIPAEEIATTIITYEEQMRGWMARIAQAKTNERLLAAYGRLQAHVETFRRIPIIPFDERALAEFARLRRGGVRIGTMDPKIAAIALTHDVVLLSRNLTDFRKVPGLRVEDWTE